VDGIDEGVFCNYFDTEVRREALGEFCNSLQPEFIAKVSSVAPATAGRRVLVSLRVTDYLLLPARCVRPCSVASATARPCTS
jgi:hypothetical protein